MTQLPNANPQGGQPHVPVPQSLPRPQRWRFRWEIAAVVLALMAALWILRGIEPSFAWEDVMDALHVRHRERYTQLAVLGLTLVGIVLVYRICRSR